MLHRLPKAEPRGQRPVRDDDVGDGWRTSYTERDQTYQSMKVNEAETSQIKTRWLKGHDGRNQRRKAKGSRTSVSPIPLTTQ